MWWHLHYICYVFFKVLNALCQNIYDKVIHESVLARESIDLIGIGLHNTL